MATPIDPIAFTEYGGAWPRPRLSKRSTALGLNYTQWGYVLAGYTLWDGGNVMWPELGTVPVPWTFVHGQWAWLTTCVLVTIALVFARWHGLHAYRAWQLVWADATTPRLSVWRPVTLAQEEHTVEDAEEDAREQQRRRHAHRAPVTNASNPLGWVVD